MTPIQGSPEVQATWERLERFQLNDNTAVFGFADRLARENGWTHRFTERVILEYKRFLLMSQHAGHPVTPSEEVDQVWHLHMVYTRSYWDKLCRDVLGRPLHHEPTAGGVGDALKHRKQYQQTLESYEHIFGSAAPADIWPPVEKRFLPMRSRWVDLSHYWLLPRPRWLKLPRRKVTRMAVAGCLGVALLAGCSPVMQALNLKGDAFIRFYITGFFGALGLSWLLLRLGRSGGHHRLTEPPSDPYDIAFLGGGGGRVADAAIASLYGRGLIKVDSSAGGHRLIAEPETEASAHLHPVEERALSALPPGVSVTPASLRNCLNPLGEQMLERLTREGLMESKARRYWLCWLAVLPLVLMMAIGTAKVAVGMERDKPVGFLVVMLAVSLFVLVWRLSSVPRRTALGDRVWRNLRQDPPVSRNQAIRLYAANSLDPATVTMLVAMGGSSALMMPGYAELLPALERPSSDANSSSGCGSSSGSSDSGGSSGCGSSGCGSSGCGGCGGGGGGGD